MNVGGGFLYDVTVAAFSFKNLETKKNLNWDKISTGIRGSDKVELNARSSLWVEAHSEKIPRDEYGNAILRCPQPQHLPSKVYSLCKNSLDTDSYIVGIGDGQG